MDAAKNGLENLLSTRSSVTEEDEVVGMISEICRICLLNSPLMRGLFLENSVLMLAEKAMNLANVKMIPNDGLPSHICYDCSDKLESAYKFKLQVEQADSILRENINSLNIKEELSCNNLDLLTQIKEVKQVTGGVLLKEFVSLGIDQKMNEEEIKQFRFKKSEDQIKKSQDINNINYQEEIKIQEDEKINQTFNKQSFQQSLEAHILQKAVIKKVDKQESMQKELSQNQQINNHEHNYVAELKSSYALSESNTLKSEGISNEIKELPQNKSGIDQVQAYVPIKSSSSESVIRRSKRKTNLQVPQIDQNSDETYFENLNLRSRLKKIKLEKYEKVYFMCYLCEERFISKDILKEHMQSHEEVKKTISLSNKPVKNCQKSSEKLQYTATILNSSTSPSSGKRPSTCPHCGKEYLYIISYNKHLKQHEKEKCSIKEEFMPLEISFHEEEDVLDFQIYDDNPVVDSNEEDEIQKKRISNVKLKLKKLNLFNCSVCEKQFDAENELRNHQSKHIDNAETECNLKSNNEKLSQSGLSSNNEVLLTKSNITSSIKMENFEEFKCPQCPRLFSKKRALVCHLGSHTRTKYSCKLCHQSFNLKDYFRRHVEQHNSRLKSFKCTQCNKTFGNELTLRNHLIATNHKTIMHGQEYNPNKRIKRVAARAAQKIIDQITTDFRMDEEEDKVNEKKNKIKDQDFNEIKEELDITDDEQLIPRKLQRFNKNIICATCNKKCFSKQALTNHMQQHVKNENIVHQEKINKPKKTNEKEENEEENEEDDDIFEGGLDWPMDIHECPTCKKQYSTKKSLLRHQLLHEEPNFECDICNVKFYRKDKLKAHYDKCSEKNPDQVRKCNICGDTFQNNEILKKHRSKHVTEGILTEQDLLETEPKLEDRNGEKTPRKRRTDIVGLECIECNKHYTSRKGLLRHIQVHEGKKYLCDICPKKFYRPEHLKIHVAKHNMIKPYKCPRCTKRFIKEEQLNNHLTKHDRTFKKSKDSDTSKRFLCEICSKSFTQSTTLIAHLRAHNGIKPYVCEVCSRPFTTNAYLKMHMRTHTQERPYICQYCSRAFARADTLANHLTSHTGEAKYHCKYCPKNFRRLKSLKEHVFIHTGQRPYACPTCDRRFNNNGSRYAHSKRCKQNLLQTTVDSNPVEILNADQELHEQKAGDPEQPQLPEQQHLQEQHLQEQQSHPQLQPQKIHHAVMSQGHLIKSPNVKTITITRQDGELNQQHAIADQEILMPLILPLTMTLTDVGEEAILPEATKIFTT